MQFFLNPIKVEQFSNVSLSPLQCICADLALLKLVYQSYYSVIRWACIEGSLVVYPSPHITGSM